MGSASASTGYNYIGVSWTADSSATISGTTYSTFVEVLIYINGGSAVGNSSQSGVMGFSVPTGNTSWVVSAHYANAVKDGYVTLGSGTVYVPQAPPSTPTPGAPSSVTVTDNTSSVDLGWTAVSQPSGTTLTYEVERGSTSIATGLTSASYTDSSPGSSRPITYGVRTKLVGNGSTYSGTTYSSWVTAQTNGTPYAPTLSSPADGAVLDLTGVQRLKWTSGFPTSTDSQSKFDLGLTSDGGTTWTTTTVVSPNSYYDVTAGTLTAGSWQWRVRVYGSTGIVGPYSSAGHFTAATPDTDLSITSPTSGDYVQQQQEVDWSVDDQQSYQVRRVADDDGTADTATVYYDSDEVTSTGGRTVTVTFDVNNRPEHLQVRVKNAAGLWSSWVDVLVFVAWTPPPAALLSVRAIVQALPAKACLRYTITTPLPTDTGAPFATSANIAARPVGATDTEWSRSRLTPNGTVDFETPASGVEYEACVTTVAENGTTTSTDWMR